MAPFGMILTGMSTDIAEDRLCRRAAFVQSHVAARSSAQGAMPLCRVACSANPDSTMTGLLQKVVSYITIRAIL